jgi:hypothetical protein
MEKSDLLQKVGGTNTLLVPGSQKFGGTGPPVPMVVAPMRQVLAKLPRSQICVWQQLICRC